MGDLERWLSPYGIAAAAIGWLVRWLVRWLLRRRKAVQVVTPSRTRRLYRFLLRIGLSTVTLHGLIEEMGLDPTSPDAVEQARHWINEHRWCGPGGGRVAIWAYDQLGVSRSTAEQYVASWERARAAR